MVHTGIGIKGVDVFKPTDLEIGGEGRNGDTATGPKGTSHSIEHNAVGVRTNRSRAPGEAKSTLAERDHRIELSIERKGSGIESFEGGTLRGSVTSEINEGLGNIDAMNRYVALGERISVTARATTNIENSHAGL